MLFWYRQLGDVLWIKISNHPNKLKAPEGQNFALNIFESPASYQGTLHKIDDQKKYLWMTSLMPRHYYSVTFSQMSLLIERRHGEKSSANQGSSLPLKCVCKLEPLGISKSYWSANVFQHLSKTGSMRWKLRLEGQSSASLVAQKLDPMNTNREKLIQSG